MPTMRRALAADLVLAAHFAFAAFAVFGGFLALLDRRIMLLHVPVVAWSSIVNLANWTCPLTPLEKRLRLRAGQPAYEGGWIQNYLEPLVHLFGTPRRLELAAGIFVVAWNIVVYLIVFSAGTGD